MRYALLAALLLFGCTTGLAPEVPEDIFESEIIETSEETQQENIEHAGVRAESDGKDLSIYNGRLALHVDLESGRLSVESATGVKMLEDAEARVLYIQGEDIVPMKASGPCVWNATSTDHEWGSGVLVEVTCLSGSEAEISNNYELLSNSSFFTVATTITWKRQAPRVARISPIVLDADTGGALYIGPDPMTHRVLDNGSEVYFDFESKMYALMEGSTLQFGPGTASNWNMAIYDPVSGNSVIAGFLTSEKGVGVIGLDYDESITKSNGGRKGFTRFEGISFYMGGRAPVARQDKGFSLSSEVLYIDLMPKTPFDGLEGFARLYARRIGKKVWDDIPSGWNSWGGGSGSGGLGQDIDENLILKNLDLASKDFKPWGMKYFMIDDGWQKADGDWEPNPDRFPSHDGKNGMKWIAEQIRAHGMIPGLWIAPFSADKGSQLAKEHPDWFAKVGPFGIGLVGDALLLDLSRPEVLDFLESKFKEIAQDWGYRWFKVDFSYYALFATDLHDPSVTPTEVYREAIRRIRKAIGPDSFLLGIAAVGLWFDDGDGNRITLDNMPRWGDPQGIGDQGIKVTYKTLAHRYYLNHNLYVLHPDLLFFRDTQGLTFEEARTWATAVALTGGIVKIGESYESMHAHPEWMEVVRRMLPVYPRSGRPLDLFLREYPEVWDMRLEREGRSWHVVGLFNWGKNRDAGSSEWDAEEPRVIGVDKAALGFAKDVLVFDSWAGTWEWVSGPRIERLLQPRSCALLIVRERPATPSVISTTRHLMGGAVEVENETFDTASGVLTALIDTVPKASISVYIATAGKALTQVTVQQGSDVKPDVHDDVVSISFIAEGGQAQIYVTFH